MKVYFVRHGESEGNRQNLHQDAQTPLSEKGREQAALVAERFFNTLIHKILVSDHKRAHDTGLKIHSKTGVPFTVIPGIGEIIRPSDVIGRHVYEPEVIDVKNTMHEHRHEPEWHYQDEENWFDVWARAKAFQLLLEAEEVESIVVVTHGFFLRMFLAALMMPEQLNTEVFTIWDEFLKLENTSVSTFEYDRECKRWWLLSWNDHSHLGEE